MLGSARGDSILSWWLVSPSHLLLSAGLGDSRLAHRLKWLLQVLAGSVKRGEGRVLTAKKKSGVPTGGVNGLCCY